MRSATTRRFALVAALVLFAPIWCRPEVVDRVPHAPGAALLSRAAADHGAAPALRRKITRGWQASGGRSDAGRGLVLLGVGALLTLLRPARAAGLTTVRATRSPLARRRHAIALRAPPLPACASQ